MNINDYKKKYDVLTFKCNLVGDEALRAVKQDGYVLQFVNIQTPEICLAAVNEDGFALRYVHVQTPEICLEAVKQYGYALKYVNENIFDKDSLSGKEVSLTIYGKTYTAIIK
jgi:hypothetical protein